MSEPCVIFVFLDWGCSQLCFFYNGRRHLLSDSGHIASTDRKYDDLYVKWLHDSKDTVQILGQVYV